MSTEPKYETIVERKAVIIADTFTNLLYPLQEETSEIILPVCSIPVLEYMIDFLFSNSITEIIICAQKNSKSLEKYLNKYHKKNKSIKLILSDAEDFTDVGDCLRKINSEKMISNDFVLVRGLIITNIDLEKAINYHLQKKKEDSNCVMTSVLKNYKNDKNVKTKYDENTLIYNKKTNRILQYESTHESRKIKLNENVKFSYKDNSANYYKIRSDLYETFIDICAPEVLNIFHENFDYQSVRDHLYRNVIVSEVYSDTFYLYEVSQDEYVGVIKNIESYLKVNDEILNRWAHPIVLENVLLPVKLEINIKALNVNTYIDHDVQISSKVKNINSILLGKGSRVGDDSEITNTSCGKGVIIGNNVLIKNSMLFDGVHVGDNSVIINSFLGEGCNIADDITLNNCVVGQGVILRSSESNMRIKSIQCEENNSENSVDNDENSCHSNNDLLLDKTDEDTFLLNLDDKDLHLLSIKPTNEGEDDEDEDEASSTNSIESDEEEDYDDELKKVLESAIHNNSKIEDIIHEISSLKNAFWEKTYAETIRTCLREILTDFVETKLKNNANFIKTHVDELSNLLVKWKCLFARFVPNKEEQINLLSVLEDIAIDYPKIIEFFHVVVQLLNSSTVSVLPDEIILNWAKEKQSSFPTSEGEKVISEDYHRLFVDKLKKFIEQL